jgi:Phage holin.
MEQVFGMTGAAAFAVAFLINQALKQTPLVNNKWLPLIGIAIGAFVGLLFGLFVDHGNVALDIIMGISAGGNSTTLNELLKHLGGKINGTN